MDTAFDGETPAAGPHDPREALQQLSRRLLDELGLPWEPTHLDAVIDTVIRRHGVPNARSWPHVVDDLARALELRASWRAAPLADVEEEALAGRPALTWTPSGWALFTRAAARRLHSERIPGTGSDAPHLRQELAHGAHAFAVVEAALPGHVLGGPARELPPLRRLFGLLRAERHDLRLVFVYALAVGILGLATPVAVQVLVNTVAFGAFRQPLLALSMMLLVALAFRAVLIALQRYVVEILQRRVFVRMVADLSERLPRVRLDAFDRASGPELVNRFFDVLTIQKSMNGLLLDGLSASMQALVGMMLLALYHPALLGFDVLLLAGIVALLVVAGRGAEQTAIIESKKKYAVAGWLEEIAAHPTIYKLAGGRELAVRRADGLARGWLSARTAHFQRFFRQYAGALGLQALANTALLTVGGWLVIEGQLTLGQLVAAEFIVASVLIGFAKFTDKLETVYDLLAAVDKLGQLVDLPLERTTGWRVESLDTPAELRVDDLTFRWGEGSTVLDGLSFAVPPGERLAICGADGSGRTTLADLLLGLREPTSGRILVDAVDLREMRLDSLRRGTVLARDAEIVTGTVSDNVALGRPEVDRDDVRAALDRVGLGHACEKLTEGIDTPLTITGAPLTEGQRARLVVARAIVTRPRLLVVDGLLDRVGPDDREVLWRALTPESAPWTLLLLTRDRALAARADRALLLDRGTVRPLPVPAGRS